MSNYRTEFPQEFWEQVAHRQRMGQRYGQAVYNTAFEMWPRFVTPLNATVHDPFYRDEKVAEFLRILSERRKNRGNTSISQGEG